jgi:hypothetical protein
VDALPPPPPPSYAYAPGDIYPRGEREKELCATASHPDWLYLGGLAALDVAAFWSVTTDEFKFDPSIYVRMTGPVVMGLAWGATVGGAWLALPKCDPHWVGSAPPEGDVRANWPIALSLALLAGASAPVIYGMGVYPCNDPRCQSGLPNVWSTEEREVHIIVAGLAGFGGALLPYLLPPRTWSSARELERLRLGADTRGNVTIGYAVPF